MKRLEADFRDRFRWVVKGSHQTGCLGVFVWGFNKYEDVKDKLIIG